MAYYKKNLLVRQGSTKTFNVNVKSDADGTPKDLTGWNEARLRVFSSWANSKVQMEFSIADGRIVNEGSTGTLKVTIDDEVTDAFVFVGEFFNGVYTLEIKNPDTLDWETLMLGEFKMHQ